MKFKSVILTTILSAALVGCASDYDTHDRRDRHSDRHSDRHERRRDEPRDRARGIPDRANLGEEGKGRIQFTARRDGQVFVEDTHDLTLVYETSLRRDDEISIHPGRDEIAINGKVVREVKINKEHRHRIYFDPESRRNDRPRGRFEDRRDDRDRRH